NYAGNITTFAADALAIRSNENCSGSLESMIKPFADVGTARVCDYLYDAMIESITGKVLCAATAINVGVGQIVGDYLDKIVTASFPNGQTHAFLYDNSGILQQMRAGIPKVTIKEHSSLVRSRTIATNTEPILLTLSGGVVSSNSLGSLTIMESG